MTKTTAPPATIIFGDGTLTKEEEEKLALLMILQHAERQIVERKYTPLAVVMKRLRARLKARQVKKR